MFFGVGRFGVETVFLLHPHENRTVSWVAMMGQKFDDYSGFYPKQKLETYLIATVPTFYTSNQYLEEIH